MKKIFTVLVLLLTLKLFSQDLIKKYDSLVSAEELKADLAEWFDWIHATHPDLTYTIKDIDSFYKNFDSLKNSINSPLTRLEFWCRLSKFNHQLSDGHFIAGSFNASYLKDFIKNNGLLFPFEVVFNEDKLLIKSDLGNDNPNKYTSWEITSINGIAISEIIQDLLLRINGDNELHRKALLERKFAYHYLLLYGEKKKFKIEMTSGNNSQKSISMKGSNTLPGYYKRREKFSRNFNFTIIDNKNALLTLKSFNWKDKERYFRFTDSVFKQLKEKNIEHLIIDIRENGGGDDDMWMKGILKYIADKPYRWGSKYKSKILLKYRDEGQVVGHIETGELNRFIPVNEKTPYKFQGKVSVLIGPFTYSSSILFANTVQDFDFATLVGLPTGGKNGQTGGIQSKILKNSQLKMICPRFILERPKGGNPLDPVIPDTIIRYNKINPDSLISEILIKN
ncbi:S41 family peptidase [Abyssalbus ytuae]|uniref:S41 family peptidase n=1 Tax=Abyssalbus ytuae TaxID=2926907 RepID=A0A9E6ZRG1_9FLAO|nr:S41 family peptidase [Abyssalbus ytuae]UOB17463.1 S41 family peptidase [Abyssalbus ytuae]